MTREQMLECLKRNLCRVFFRKLDGTERLMECTLHPSSLPQKESMAKTTKKENFDNISVWDIEKQDWRSFRIDSILSFEEIWF